MLILQSGLHVYFLIDEVSYDQGKLGQLVVCTGFLISFLLFISLYDKVIPAISYQSFGETIQFFELDLCRDFITIYNVESFLLFSRNHCFLDSVCFPLFLFLFKNNYFGFGFFLLFHLFFFYPYSTIMEQTIRSFVR